MFCNFTKKLQNITTTIFQNPFNTPVGQKIDILLQSIDWPTVLDLQDDLNSTTTNPQLFTRCLRKRLQKQNLQNIIFILEIVVKNCKNQEVLGEVFQAEFLNELLKTCSSGDVQEKLLSLIEEWHKKFPREKGLEEIYEDLKSKGVEFPGIEVGKVYDMMEPVEFKPTQTQLFKIREDLAVVQTNIEVFNEVLSEGIQADGDFLRQLYETCREMQQRVAALLGNLTDADVVGELLVVNDALNSVFLRYGRYQNSFKKDPKEEPDLIDMSSEEMDSVVKDHKATDFQEMEDWLKENPSSSQMSSSEFDKFLQERASKS